jgi:hypothetical protein
MGLGISISRGTKSFAAVSALVLSWAALWRIERVRADDELSVEHAECVFFGPEHERFAAGGLNRVPRERYAASALTASVTGLLPAAHSGRASFAAARSSSRTNAAQPLDHSGTIDKYLFGAMQQAGVQPAQLTDDYEFARRVTLDITGRIPTQDRLLSFVADDAPDKRAKLVDELLQSPEWVDKWTMYFGDLLKNTDRINSQSVTRYAEGRNAFYNWIKSGLAANKPYDQLVREVISAKGENSWEDSQGAINWTVGGIVQGGPIQDVYDQQATNVAETFLGMAQMNCLLCHNGRGHLDMLSLWGKTATRASAWGLAAFYSHTSTARTPSVAGQPQPYYWAVRDSTDPKAVDYRLNTSTGNRPARTPIGSTSVIAPVYPFSGKGPKPGENYREVLGREVTADFQFARATVNYIWKEFFTLGLVEPANQFDPARLDPDNPPAEPWTLQPSNPRLLNALAQDFIDSGFDLKALMRKIATSQAYQLSSRYTGEWNPAWEKLYARKLVRRLWAEEIHDALVQASNVAPNYRVTPDWFVKYAMQLPEPRGFPGGTVTAFLDSFLRGNREDNERSSEGSPSQALSLMNDSFVMTRIKASGSGATASLLSKYINASDEVMVINLYLSVLSRYPTEAEKNVAMASLKTGARSQKAENLLWSLYNKVDFVFNY